MIDFMNLKDNIPDEVLAAYIAGNASPVESSMIQDSLRNDNLLLEVVDVVNDISSLEDGMKWNFEDYADGPLAIDIPFGFQSDDCMAAMLAHDSLCADTISAFDSSIDVCISDDSADDMFDFSI